MGTPSILEQHQRRDLLRFLTAGSVDDGKSTLIGRLLHDSRAVYQDHMATLERDSRRQGSAGGELDFALLLDGLRAEREQGITIDVAYRYFATERRKFIIADCPGHEQYTRNMATGGSTADLAVILVDATQGVRPQTKRHSFIAALLGIKHLVVAINKMDLVDYSQDIYDEIVADYTGFAARLEVSDVHVIPMSALCGDNVVERSEKMPWFRGGALLDYLESVHIASDRNLVDFRMPVQLVLRPDLSFRGYAGTIAAGILRAGDEILVLPSGKRSHVASIETFDGSVEEAFPPMAVAVTLADEIDISRGDVIVRPNNVPEVGVEFDAAVVWMAEQPLDTDREYIIKHATSSVPARVDDIRYRIDINSLHRVPATQLALNEIGRVHVALRRPLAFDTYARAKQTGSFIIVDRLSNLTVAAGMVLPRRSSPLMPASDAERERARSSNVRATTSSIASDEREARYGHRPATIWITGLPKAGKTSLARAVERALFDLGCQVVLIDGATLRMGLSKDLGFSGKDRSESARRGAGVAKLFNDAGSVAICAFISPYEMDRAAAKRTVGEERFVEVFVDAPEEVVRMARDEDGLYERAKRGEIAHFSGVTAPYEEPVAADLSLRTDQLHLDDAVGKIIALLKERQIIKPAS